MTDFLADAMTRVVEMQKLALPDTKAAFSNPLATYPNFPFWVNTLSTITPRTAPTALQQTTEYVVRMRLVIGHMKEGYEGTLPDKLWAWTPQVLEYFQARKHLQYQAGQAAVRYLSPLGTEIRLSRGFSSFQVAQDIIHIGTEFELVVPFVRVVAPAYQ